MANLTQSEETQYKEHIFLADNYYNNAHIALNSGCTVDAMTKLNSALKHYRDAGEIVMGKSDSAITIAIMGINKCNDLINAIKEESRDR